MIASISFGKEIIIYRQGRRKNTTIVEQTHAIQNVTVPKLRLDRGKYPILPQFADLEWLVNRPVPLRNGSI